MFFAILGLRWLRHSPPQKVAQFIRSALAVGAIMILLFLAASGRLHWLFALVGSLLAMLPRLLPLLRYFPLLRRWYAHYHAGPANNTDTAGGGSQNQHHGQLSAAEAYKILGLQEGAGREEIVSAHRRLIQKLHPDHGGSSYLAAQLNHARNVLLDLSGGQKP